MPFSFDPKNVTGFYTLNEAGEPVIERDLNTWAEWFERKGARSVARNQVNAHVVVSTVFLGLDHRFVDNGPPILWETIVFVKGQAEETRRYSSRAAAFAGHEKLVEEWRGNVQNG